MGVGSQGTKSLSAAPPRTTSLHLFNLSTSTSIDDITGHVKRLIKTGEIRCEQLITRGDYSSFRLDVPAASLKAVCDPGVWPEGVSICRFNVVSPESKNLKTQQARKPNK
ncbi:hypothetical protein O0L34_g19073 [Tuta absoluta]|nr:hypothetical protein O0L34_g19073 [Tuta absoluta]